MNYRSTTLLCALAFGLGMSDSAIAGEATPVLKNRSIGYVLTHKFWVIHQTSDRKVDCPDGLNIGSREQFKIQYPEDGTERSYLDTALRRESDVWFPRDSDQFPYSEPAGKIVEGLNLDGKIGPRNFTSPDGEKGIDNQMYRVLGCVASYRGGAGEQFTNTNKFMQDFNFNRVVLELTDVDNLTNDDDVSVTLYRGQDPLLMNSQGTDYMPRGTQHLDLRWGKEFVRHFHARIVNGVLETDAQDTLIPHSGGFQDYTVHPWYALRWRLKLTPDGAEGLMAGYADIDGFYRQLNQSISTHHLAYGQIAAPSVYRALARFADGYPDPKTGRNTAISAAMRVRFRQAYVVHPEEQTTSNKDDTHAILPNDAAPTRGAP